jgi:hypothetical protein
VDTETGPKPMGDEVKVRVKSNKMVPLKGLFLKVVGRCGGNSKRKSREKY